MKNIIKNLYVNMRRQYKIICIMIIILLLCVLYIGNYNLIEGLTVDEEINHLQELVTTAEDETKKFQKISNMYNRDDNLRKRKIEIEREGFIENMKNECDYNYSELGGNNANRLIHSQCESLRTLKSKNKSILGKDYSKDYDKYVTKN